MREPAHSRSLCSRWHRPQARARAADEFWAQIAQAFLPGHDPKDADPIHINEALDVGLRARLFVLATHYWEGRWLLEMQKTRAWSSEQKRKKGASAVQARWRLRMMITPCAVSTFYTLPRHLKCVRHEDGKFVDDYLFNGIYWLIVDESGQVLPEVAAGAFALAKKALVVGDTQQIAPIYSVSEHLDRGNLVLEGLLEDATNEADFGAWQISGKLASNGSVMAMAQHATAHHQHPALARGLYLVEHRRCVDEIIGYCNDLCYGGALRPMRGPKKGGGNLDLPAMGYLHVPGLCESEAGSRVNRLEAQSIAQWILEHRESLETEYTRKGRRPSIGELIGIVTPFAGQKYAILQALKQAGLPAESITVGTVHALQGAERPVVLFSPTYSKHNRGGFIDQDASMLNVAVSRAKDSFLVFGDMDLFNEGARTPSGLLAQYLAGHELAPIQSIAREDLTPAKLGNGNGEALSPVLHNAQEHDLFLHQVLKDAKHQILLVSPWLKKKRLDPFKDALRAAAQRGVKVLIYTDLGFNQGSRSVSEAREELKPIVAEYAAMDVSIQVVRSVHSKVLARDEDLLCLGSFNWLSAVREANYAHHNHETSMVYQGQKVAEEISIQLDDMAKRAVRL